MAKFKSSILQSTTLEGAFLEVAFLLEKIETASNAAKKLAKPAYDKLNEQEKLNVQQPLSGFEETKFFNITLDSDQQRCIILVNLPGRIEQNSFGGYFLAKELFPDNEVADLENLGYDKLLAML